MKDDENIHPFLANIIKQQVGVVKQKKK